MVEEVPGSSGTTTNENLLEDIPGAKEKKSIKGCAFIERNKKIYMYIWEHNKFNVLV